MSTVKGSQLAQQQGAYHTMRTNVVCFWLLFVFSTALAQDPPFTVTRPEPGDTLILSSSTSGSNLYVDWIPAPGTEDQPVSITLQQGDDLEKLETIESVIGVVPNTGNYTWNSSNSTSLASGREPELARTACNYTVRLSTDGLVAYSRYFTIINENDGPVLDDASCPVERGVSRPLLDAGSADSGLGDDSSVEASSSSGGGISASTLAVAIVVPIVVLLLAFGLLLWFGIRRGWLIKLASRLGKHPPSPHETAYSSGQWQPYQNSPTDVEKKEEPAPYRDLPPQELHSDHRPWEAEAHQIYQLEGDERDARWQGDHMRSRGSNIDMY